MSLDFKDFSDDVLEALAEQALNGLERCGLQGEGYAKDLAPVGDENGGYLRNSIAHKVDPAEPAAYIGTNAEYAAYVEFGTGKHSTIGGGTPKEKWAYRREDGEWRTGYPQEPQPFLKPAVADHVQTYINIINDELKG